MKRTFFFSAGSSIYRLVIGGSKNKLKEIRFHDDVRALAIDSFKKERLYVGTFNDGLWICDNDGETRRKVEEGIPHGRIISIATGGQNEKNDDETVWVGTEPSGLFQSEDGGKTWTDFPALLELPSKSTWSFPPRPYTHHVRSIQPDIHQPNRIFVGIELGGVMKSEDGGKVGRIGNVTPNTIATH